MALLDLAHSLRVISEAPEEVARIVANRGVKGLPHASLGPALRKVIGKSDFWAILLPGGVQAGCVEASTFLAVNRNLSDDEHARMSRLLRAHIIGESLAPKGWFGAEVVVARRTTPLGTERTGLSRTMAIKRVSNTLGGSHLGSDGSDNRFDWLVELLLNLRIGSIPAPYCVLMKIAQDLLVALDPALSAYSLLSP